ncbi:2-(3-amino-3-carboxypropyl)histidine synthase [Pancytospora philotis]|nr:2-(3-amino-3-carboxypropyl)histidine synthase [Pancytospora philotis]
MVVILEEPSAFPNSVAGLPENYNFEIRKTLSMITKISARRVALQFPDGLLSYAPLLIDAIETHTGADCYILDDVVYGACCVDDDAIEADLIVHYGHSCLVPITEMKTRVLYVFVDISIDVEHLYQLILANFRGPVAIIGTIQFNASVNKLKRMINQAAAGNASCEGCACAVTAFAPQVKPLSPGEVLGCTSPVITGASDVVYIGDGRFHLESAMIRNPSLNFYKYCPFTRKMSREFYKQAEMVQTRRAEIARAFAGRTFGVILGSLGRQGNRKIMANVIRRLEKNYQVYRIVVDEINEQILDQFGFVDAFVQVSCPRLSIDWGACYHKPLLSPFEVFYENEYAMDYYSREGSAPWKNYNNDMV